MNFDFIQSLNAETNAVTNKRGGSDASIDPALKTTSTTGNISLNTWAAKGLGGADGSRYTIFEMPTAVGGVPVTIEKTGCAYAIALGVLSNAEKLQAEYKAANPQSFATGSDELTAYNEAMAVWISEQLTARGLADNSVNGAKARLTGSGFQFSSRNPWTLLGGNTTENRYFDMIRAYGIAQDASGAWVLITNSNKAELAETAKGLAGYNASGEGNIWQQATSMGEVTGTPFYVLSFAQAKPKSTRGTGEGEATPVAAAPVAAPAPVVEDDVDFGDFDTEL